MDKTSFGEEVYSVVQARKGPVVPDYSLPGGKADFVPQVRYAWPAPPYVNSQGRLAPFWPEQRELLEKEGTVFKKNGCVDIKASGWEILKEVIS